MCCVFGEQGYILASFSMTAFHRHFLIAPGWVFHALLSSEKNSLLTRYSCFVSVGQENIENMDKNWPQPEQLDEKMYPNFEDLELHDSIFTSRCILMEMKLKRYDMIQYR